MEKPAQGLSPSSGTQEKQQQVRPSSIAGRQSIPSQPAVRVPKEMRTPERGMDRRMENPSPEKGGERTMPAERVQPEPKKPVPPQKVMQQAPENRIPDKRTDRQKERRNPEKGA
jgi:hypothetical protein